MLLVGPGCCCCCGVPAQKRRWDSAPAVCLVDSEQSYLCQLQYTAAAAVGQTACPWGMQATHDTPSSLWLRNDCGCSSAWGRIRSALSRCLYFLRHQGGGRNSRSDPHAAGGRRQLAKNNPPRAKASERRQLEYQHSTLQLLQEEVSCCNDSPNRVLSRSTLSRSGYILRTRECWSTDRRATQTQRQERDGERGC